MCSWGCFDNKTVLLFLCDKVREVALPVERDQVALHTHELEPCVLQVVDLPLKHERLMLIAEPVPVQQ